MFIVVLSFIIEVAVMSVAGIFKSQSLIANDILWKLIAVFDVLSQKFIHRRCLCLYHFFCRPGL